ncbi:MAG: HAD family phosphatase [Methylococcaceae bacterium]|nr:MAG: HAD family phosphatase [Methylococcaceae bacterium]
MTTRFTAVIFDLDGLVLDTETTYRLAWERAATDMGHSLNDAFFAGLSGLQGSEVEAALLAELGTDFALADFKQRGDRHWQRHVDRHGIAVKPGFHALLEHIQRRRLPFGLATNSRRHYAELCLRLAGLDATFPIMAAREDVARGKPAPDVFLQAARLLGAEPDSCLVLEDSLPGLTAAHQAGMAPVLITHCADTARAGAELALRVLPTLDAVVTAGLL